MAARVLLGASLAVLAAIVVPQAGMARADEGDLSPLFNGKDLTGWVRVNCAPTTFSVRDGMIVSTGVPTGVLRSEKQYENFVLELEWRHMQVGGNAGLFVWSDPLTAAGVPFTRSIEVQILDGRNSETYTSHGDVFAIHGAVLTPDRPHPRGAMRCLPSEHRCKPAGEWNHYRVTCQDGALKLEVNGKEVSGGSGCRPRKGYICLESEGTETHFRNLRIRELPSSGATNEQTAPEALDYQPLYTGLDLSGWRQDSAGADLWKANDWRLIYPGSEASNNHLWTDRAYGDFELICDWRFTGEPKATLRPKVLPTGEIAEENGAPIETETLDAGDSGIFLRGSEKSQVGIWCWPIGSGDVAGYRTDQSQPAEIRAGATPGQKADKPIGEWNRFLIRMVGDRLTVHLNEKLVIDEARLPNIAERGPIGLESGDGPIEFANLFVRELTANEDGDQASSP